MYGQLLLIVLIDRLNTAVHKTVIAAIDPPYLKADVAGGHFIFRLCSGFDRLSGRTCFSLKFKFETIRGLI